MRKRKFFQVILAVVLLFSLTSQAFAGEIGTNDFRISDAGGLGNTDIDTSFTAVAYNSIHNEFLVVWAADETNNEYEVYGQRIDAVTGAELGNNDFRISDVGPNGDTAYDVDTSGPPGVAYNAAADEYLVVWSGDEIDGALEIYGQRIYGDRASGDTLGANDFRISSMGAVDSEIGYDAVTPAVAYNSTNSEYLVVWHGDDGTDGENEIYGQRLNATTLAAVGNDDFRISTAGPDANTAYDAEHPDVVWNATNNEYLVVWNADDNAGGVVEGENEIFGQRIYGDRTSGDAVGNDDFRISDMGPDGNIAYDADDVAVAWNSTSNEYLVVWEGEDNIVPLVSGEMEIFGQRIYGNRASGDTFGTNDFRISDMGPNGNTSYFAYDPDVVYNSVSNEYLVVWDGDDNTSPLVDDEKEVFGQRITAAGAETGVDFRISDMGPDGNVAYDADNSAVAYSPTSNHYLALWDGDDNTGGQLDGEEESFSQLLNFVPPTVILVNTNADTGDGELTEDEQTTAAITQLLVSFSEPVNDPAGNTGASDVTNPANYMLFNDGGDGFDTLSCTGGIVGNDSAITINSVAYASATGIATLSVNGGGALPDAAYRLLVCGTTSIQDTESNKLDGNGDLAAGDDFARNFTVGKLSSTTTITSDNPDPSTPGQAVTVVFTVISNGSPTGTVTVTDSASAATCNATVAVGQCNITLSTLGARTLTATYAGDSNNNGSADGEPHSVKAATTTTITSDNPDPSVAGQTVTVVFTVTSASGTPTGTVTVTESLSAATCNASVATGQCDITLPTVGASTLTATYGGDSSFNGSLDTEGHTVNKANTTTTITSDSADPSAVGVAVTVQFTVTATAPGGGTPSGTVTITESLSAATCNATVAVGQCDITLPTAGASTLTATYGGDANYNGSLDTEGHTVSQAATATTITSDSADPSVTGEAITVQFTVTSGGGTPTGTVTVTDSLSAATCNATVAVGQCDITLPGVGARTLTATYAGDSNFTGSNDNEPHLVNKANTTTAITSDSADPSVTGETVTVQFTVVAAAPGGGTPTGTVTVTDSLSAATCNASVATGQCDIVFAAPGARTLTATYAGDANYNGSLDTEGHTVNKANSATTITSDTPDPSNTGQAVTVVFTVTAAAPGSGTPTGTVTVTDSLSAATCNATVAVGQCDITLPTAGNSTLTATYAGDANFNGGLDTEPHVVNQYGTDTMGVYVSSNGRFKLRNTNDTGLPDLNFDFATDVTTGIPIVGDWDGDGVDTIGIYNPVNGEFRLRNSNSAGPADITIIHDNYKDSLPLTGDWDGDGTDTLGLYRNQTYWMRNTNDVGGGDIEFTYGAAGIIPIIGDWDGDGVDTIGAFDPVAGEFQLRNTNSAGPADLILTHSLLVGATPLAGDWDSDGTDTIGIYKGGKVFLRNTNTIGQPDVKFNFGGPGMVPISGDWDGN